MKGWKRQFNNGWNQGIRMHLMDDGFTNYGLKLDEWWMNNLDEYLQSQFNMTSYIYGCDKMDKNFNSILILHKNLSWNLLINCGDTQG
jgi:hypothetical protein